MKITSGFEVTGSFRYAQCLFSREAHVSLSCCHQNIAIQQWNRDAIDVIEEEGLDWLPVCEPVMRGWSQELGHATYGYGDHFHPVAHVYSLWARMLLSVLRQPRRW